MTAIRKNINIKRKSKKTLKIDLDNPSPLSSEIYDYTYLPRCLDLWTKKSAETGGIDGYFEFVVEEMNSS